MTRILLTTINAKWTHPSLALRLLKANLGTLASQAEILEFALRQPLEEKVSAILAAKPLLLGLSVSIWNHKASIELLEALEQNWSWGQGMGKPIVVLGGPEVSHLPPETEIFRYANYVIRGEGEESFRLLCETVFSESKENEMFNTEAFFINDGKATVDINKISSAYHLYTDEDISRKLIYVEASRGCPFTCDFCQGGLTAMREFPLDTFLTEMDTLIQRVNTRSQDSLVKRASAGSKLEVLKKPQMIFKFLDRTFNLNMNRAKRIMEFFLERPGTQVHFEMVPSRFPPELREVLCRFPPGSLRLELGIQTVNPEVKSRLRLSGDANKELETLAFLRDETNAIVHADLIAGLPGENYASFGAGFDSVWQVMSGASGISKAQGIAKNPFEIQLGILKCLNGTPIYRHTEAFGMRYSTEPPYEVIETSALSASGLDRIKNFARFWELIVNRNPFPDLTPLIVPPGEKAFNRFMGISDTLLAKFGKNWGIAKSELRLVLESILNGKGL